MSSQKSLKDMEEETNQLLEATKTLANRANSVIDNVNKNIELRINQLQKENKELSEKIASQDKNLSQTNNELQGLKDQKSKLLQDIREKDLKIDTLEREIKELQKKVPH